MPEDPPFLILRRQRSYGWQYLCVTPEGGYWTSSNKGQMLAHLRSQFGIRKVEIIDEAADSRLAHEELKVIAGLRQLAGETAA